MALVLWGLLAFFVLFFFLPIQVGIFGCCREHRVWGWGWIRPWAGLLGLKVTLGKGGPQIAFTIGAWTLVRKSLKRKVKKEVKKTEEEEEEAPVETPEEPVRVSFWSRLKDFWRYVQRLSPSVGRFFRRFVRGIGVRKLAFSAVYGAADPATTGRIFGYVLAISSVTGPRIRMDLVPDFTRERMEGDGEVVLLISLYWWVWAVVCLGLRVAWVWAGETWRRRRRDRMLVEAKAANGV